MTPTDSPLIPAECWCIVLDISKLSTVLRMGAVNRQFRTIVSDYLSRAGPKRALLLRMWTTLSPPASNMPFSFFNAFYIQQGDSRVHQLREIKGFIAAEKDRLRDAPLDAICRVAQATLPFGDCFRAEMEWRLGHYGFTTDNRLPKELGASLKNWDRGAPYVSWRLQYEGLRDSYAPFRSILLQLEQSRDDTALISVRLLVTIANRLNRGLPVDDYLQLLESNVIPEIQKKTVLFQVHFFVHLARLYITLDKLPEAKVIILSTIETVRSIHCPEQKGYAWSLLGSLIKDEEIAARLVVCLQELIKKAEDKQIYLYWMVHVLLYQGKENISDFVQYLSVFEQSLTIQEGPNTINMLLRAADIHLLGKSFCNSKQGVDYLQRALKLATSNNKLEEQLVILPDWATATMIRFALEKVKNDSLRSKVLLEMARLGRLEEAADLISHFKRHLDPVFLNEFRHYAPNQASKLTLSLYTDPEKAIQSLYDPEAHLSSVIRGIEVMLSLGLSEHEAQARLVLKKMKPTPEIVRWQAVVGDTLGVMATLAVFPNSHHFNIIAIRELAQRLIA